jgi:hypothetical protein
MLLIGSGLIGLAGFRRKFRKRELTRLQSRASKEPGIQVLGFFITIFQTLGPVCVYFGSKSLHLRLDV